MFSPHEIVVTAPSYGLGQYVSMQAASHTMTAPHATDRGLAVASTEEWGGGGWFFRPDASGRKPRVVANDALLVCKFTVRTLYSSVMSLEPHFNDQYTDH